MNNRFYSLITGAALVLNLLPNVAVAQNAGSVSAQNTVAGLGTIVDVSCAPNSTVGVTVTPPSGYGSQQTVTVDSSGKAMVNVSGAAVQRAGTYSVSACGASANFTVMADRPSNATSRLSVSKTANGMLSISVSVQDAYGNAVDRPILVVGSPSAFSTIVKVTGGSATVNVPAPEGVHSLIAFDMVTGAQLAVASLGSVQMTNPFTASLTAYAQGGEGDIGPSGSSVTHFRIAFAKQGAQTANEFISATVTALNAQNQIVQDYLGTVVMTSSDPAIECPNQGYDVTNPRLCSVAFRAPDLGVRSIPLSIRFGTPGTHTLTVTAKDNPSIKGDVSTEVVGGSGQSSGAMEILDPADRSTIGDVETVLVQGRAPSLINITVTKGKEVYATESDKEGVFRIELPVGFTEKEMVITAKSENGTYQAAPVLVFIDREKPGITSIDISPNPARATELTTILVKAEPDMKKVVATIGTAEIPLAPTGSGSAQYAAQFNAPGKGDYDVKVTATDTAGNETSMLTKWIVNDATMPTVTGVTAQGKVDGVELKWNAVTADKLSSYAIYISLQDDPTNYLYSVQTGKPVTSAVVKDLPAGKTYLFALTALSSDGLESAEKSVPAAAAPLGMSVTAIAGDGSVQLKWVAPAGVPLNQYILDYGVGTNLTEQRAIAGGASTYTVRDLINGIAYTFRLTPVVTTGKTLTELSETVVSTPNGSGFHGAAGDPIPEGAIGGNTSGHSGAPLNELPGYIPSNPATGFPTTAAMVLLALAVGAGLFYRKTRREHMLAQQFLKTMDQKYHN